MVQGTRVHLGILEPAKGLLEIGAGIVAHRESEETGEGHMGYGLHVEGWPLVRSCRRETCEYFVRGRRGCGRKRVGVVVVRTAANEDSCLGRLEVEAWGRDAVVEICHE